MPYPLHALSDRYLIVAGKFNTAEDGSIISVDMPFVQSITSAVTANQTIYTLNLTRWFNACMYINASSSIGSHLVLVGEDVSNRTTPKFWISPRDIAARGNCVVNGGIVSDPTTPSSQITGAGNTTWNVNITACSSYIDGVFGEIAAQTDYCLHSGSKLLNDGQSVICSVVAKAPAGIFEFDYVMGTPATTGSQAAPSRSDISTALGFSSWTKVRECLLNRTGDTTLTQSYTDYTRDINGWYFGLHNGTAVELGQVNILAVMVD